MDQASPFSASPDRIAQFRAVWNTCRHQEEGVSAICAATGLMVSEVRRNVRLLVKARLLKPLPLLHGCSELTDEVVLEMSLVWARCQTLDQVARIFNWSLEETLTRARLLRRIGVALSDKPDGQLEMVPLPDALSDNVREANRQLDNELLIRRTIFKAPQIRHKLGACLGLLASFKKSGKKVDNEVAGAVALLEDVLRDMGVVG